MGGIVSTPPTHKFPLPTMETCDYVRPSKLLLNVTIENSLGAIQVLLSPEDTVADLVNAALLIYEKEKRRPLLKDTDPKCYDLHYSSYTLQSNPSLLFTFYYILWFSHSQQIKYFYILTELFIWKIHVFCIKKYPIVNYYLSFLYCLYSLVDLKIIV